MRLHLDARHAVLEVDSLWGEPLYLIMLGSVPASHSIDIFACIDPPQPTHLTVMAAMIIVNSQISKQSKHLSAQGFPPKNMCSRTFIQGYREPINSINGNDATAISSGHAI